MRTQAQMMTPLHGDIAQTGSMQSLFRGEAVPNMMQGLKRGPTESTEALFAGVAGPSRGGAMADFGAEPIIKGGFKDVFGGMKDFSGGGGGKLKRGGAKNFLEGGKYYKKDDWDTAASLKTRIGQ